MKIAAFLLTCAGREEECARTLARLAETDWGEVPAIHCDRAGLLPPWRSIAAATRTLLAQALADEAERTTSPSTATSGTTSKPGRPCAKAASISAPNPGLRAADGGLPPRGVREYPADPALVFGSQAFLHSRACVQELLARWEEFPVNQDRRRPLLAARLGPVLCHRPSLVQHTGVASRAGHRFHRAMDFDPAFRGISA